MLIMEPFDDRTPTISDPVLHLWYGVWLRHTWRACLFSLSRARVGCSM
jgi:hypothetical protein